MAMYSTVQGPKPLMASRRSLTSAGAASNRRAPVTTSDAIACSARARAAVRPIDRRSKAATCSGVGKVHAMPGSCKVSGSLVAQRRDQPPGQRARAGDRDLLSQDRAHRGLEAVPRAWNTHARQTPFLRPELRRCRQRRRDPIGVRVEVEETPDTARDRLLHLGRRVASRREQHCTSHFGPPERRPKTNLQHTRDRRPTAYR